MAKDGRVTRIRAYLKQRLLQFSGEASVGCYRYCARMDLDRYESELRQALGAATGKYQGPDLVFISPEIERRKLLAWSAPSWLRELSWNTLPVVLGTVVAAGILALIALAWRHVI